MHTDAPTPYLFSTLTQQHPDPQAEPDELENEILQQPSLGQKLRALLRQRDLIRAQDKTLTQEIKVIRHALSKRNNRHRLQSESVRKLKANNKLLQYELALLARESGKTYSELGLILGVSRQRAHIIYQEAKQQRRQD